LVSATENHVLGSCLNPSIHFLSSTQSYYVPDGQSLVSFENSKTNMSRTRLRRVRPTFPLMDLPADLQLLILSKMDLHTLQNIIQAVPHVRETYLRYPSSILRGAVAEIVPQVRNLLLTTYRLTCIIRSGDVSQKPDLSNMGGFLADNLDTEKPRKIDFLEHDALDALHTFCEIDAEVMNLVQDYAKDIYERACHRDNPGAIPPPLVLSPNERYRMMRAFYRLKFFGVLFYNYVDRFNVHLEPFYAEFFNRLSTFEIDELVTAYQFVLRERRWFKSVCIPHDCSWDHSRFWISIDPFNCERCRGQAMGYVEVQPGRTRRRAIQPFWYTVMQERFVDRDGLWAERLASRPKPIKNWDDISEANEPNKGWLSWCEVRDNPIWLVDKNAYVKNFRILGYCFWDRTRLKGWGDMFQEEWFGEQIVRFRERSGNNDLFNWAVSRMLYRNVRG
jgi:hypothetical protein